MAGELIIGTAGHVDHGKTALVRALTGTDTDRLAEERRRGLSIVLGYAELLLPSGRRRSIVDVPGHERFVRAMVAGASGIDACLICVAADDGVMPQTVEHAAVLHALDVRQGVVAVTKCDLAPPSAAAAGAAQLFPGMPVVPVSVVTGEGLEALREALAGFSPRAGRGEGRGEGGGRAGEGGSAGEGGVGAGEGGAGERGEGAGERGEGEGGEGEGEALMHVDRVFTLRGPGTVVTGTLWSGAISAGERLVALPAGRVLRVRSVQVHNQAVARAVAGQRVALALGGAGRGEVAPGDALAAPGTGVRATYRVDVTLSGSTALRSGQRIVVHHGTRDTPAVAVALNGGHFQLRLRNPLMPRAGDRVVLREGHSTLGGAEVLDPAPPRHRGGGTAGLPAPDPSRRCGGGTTGVPAPAPSRHRGAGETGVPAGMGTGGSVAAGAGESEKGGIGSSAEGGAGSRPDADTRTEVLRARLVSAGLPDLPEIAERVVQIAQRNGDVSVSALRDALQTNRATALELLRHFDDVRLTVRRRDDIRVLRRAGPRDSQRIGD